MSSPQTLKCRIISAGQKFQNTTIFNNIKAQISSPKNLIKKSPITQIRKKQNPTILTILSRNVQSLDPNTKIFNPQCLSKSQNPNIFKHSKAVFSSPWTLITISLNSNIGQNFRIPQFLNPTILRPESVCSPKTLISKYPIPKMGKIKKSEINKIESHHFLSRFKALTSSTKILIPKSSIPDVPKL